MTTTKTTTSLGLKVTTRLKAGGVRLNHSRGALKVRTGLNAGGVHLNHSRSVV
jgi:hypothetical protein